MLKWQEEAKNNGFRSILTSHELRSLPFIDLKLEFRIWDYVPILFDRIVVEDHMIAVLQRWRQGPSQARILQPHPHQVSHL
jgi:hypothetical protein